MKNTVDPEIFRELFDDKDAKITENLIGYLFLDNSIYTNDDAEYRYGIIKFKNKYYRAEWAYYSHIGLDFYGILDSIVEVTPRQVTTTVWEIK